MSDDSYVYIAEAYKDGGRIERLVHTSYADAKEDIEISTGTDNPDRIEIDKEKVWLGQDDEFHVTR
jgi:hypothetical protein